MGGWKEFYKILGAKVVLLKQEVRILAKMIIMTQ